MQVITRKLFDHAEVELVKWRNPKRPDQPYQVIVTESDQISLEVSDHSERTAAEEVFDEVIEELCEAVWISLEDPALLGLREQAVLLEGEDRLLVSLTGLPSEQKILYKLRYDGLIER